MRISAVAGSPRSPLSHTAATLRARRRDRRTKGLHLSLGCAAWPGARDVLNNSPILMNLSRMVAKSALLRDWCLEWCRAQNAIQ